MPTALNLEDHKTKIEMLFKSLPELRTYFDIQREVGEGTFSTVYLAIFKNDQNDLKKKYAIKHIVPTCHPDRVKLELKCLKMIGGSNNVAGIDLCLRNDNDIVFVMPYLHHVPFSEYYDQMDAAELALYMKNLLIAVAHVHKFGIIHRDIKPSNFLYNRKKKQFLLVDFGLAQLNSPNSNQCNKRKRDMSSPNNKHEEITQIAKRPMLKSPIKHPFEGELEFANILPNKSDQENIPNNLTNEESKKENNVKDLNHVDVQKLPNKEGLKLIPKSTISDKKKVPAPKYCNCYGKPIICSICLTKKTLVASRAGTPGFRPPEVLLKLKNQTTAVDVWAVGVIFLSLLSHTCNFFSSPDDITALAEMVTVFGTDQIKKIAHKCNRHLVTSENLPGVKLEELCKSLRNRGGTVTAEYPKSAFDLLGKLLDVNPHNRITSEKALQEAFVQI